MASHTYNLNTWSAKRVLGDNQSQNPAGALLQSGAGRADNSTTGDTWIFWDTIGGTGSPWGIRHNQGANTISLIGSGTTGSWVNMNTGNSYFRGNMGIGTESPAYKLHVSGMIHATEGIDLPFIKKTVDLSALDVNTYYPVVSDSMPYRGFNRIKLSVQLNSGTVPSWSTHSAGFTVLIDVLATASGWGTTSALTIILQDSYNFADAHPASYQQITNSSRAVFYLRGGGKYFIYTDWNTAWTICTASTTYSSQTVAPTTTRPENTITRATIWANINGNAKYDGNGNEIAAKYVTLDTTQTISGLKHFTGNLQWGTSDQGGILYGNATNGGLNSMRIGDDIYLGDCNVSGILGLKSTATNCGFYFHNSSGTQTGQFYNNGSNFYMNKLLLINTNNNTLTIGAQNTSYCHFSNSANIPFWFNNNIHIESGKTIGGSGTQYRPFQLYLGRYTTSGSNALGANNPLIEFSNSDRSQYCQLIYDDWDSLVAPDSLTLVGNQNVWFICKNGPIWVQGGSNAGGNVNRLTTSGGMPGNMQYNTSRRGTQIYSNGIAFCDPYNGNNNSDAGWIRHIETTGNTGELEIAVGDDGSEVLALRQYNTSNAIAHQAYLDSAGRFNFANANNSSYNYDSSAIWIREAGYTGSGSDTWGQAPRLGWHWSGRAAAQIGLASDGWLYEAPLTGTSFYKIVCETGTWGISITGNAATASRLVGSDTRSANSAPSTYYSIATIRTEFKSRSAIGAPGSSSYGTTVTIAPWVDSSGGLPVQLYFDNTGISAVRYASSADAWGGWSKFITSNQFWLSNASHSVTLANSTWGASNPWNCGNRTLVWGQQGKTSASADTADIVLYYGTHSSAGGAGWFLSIDGGINSLAGIYTAVWNDFAEYRESDVTEPGRCVVSNGKGQVILSTERLQPGGHIISDTFGQSVGYSDTARTPLGVAGRVLAYPYQDRENYQVGDCVCSAPDGTVDRMTREEIVMYPDRIVGVVDEIPGYEVWKQDISDEDGKTTKSVARIKVQGRIWIYAR